MNWPQTEVGLRRRRWRIAIYGAFTVGVLGLLVGVNVGRDLAGALVYLGGVAVGSACCLYACYWDDLTLRDERFAAIERRASHYTVSLIAYVGIATFPLLFVLEAADEFTFGPALEAALYAASALFVLWSVVYVALRIRS